MIEPDNEIQEGIDAEEAEAQAMADENGDENKIDEEEYRLLRLLEDNEREIARAEVLKKEEAAFHNEGIKALEATRDGLLQAITDYRRGEQALPFDE